jgi:DNA-binding transcriptional regulator LsrR (DeoR family)
MRTKITLDEVIELTEHRFTPTDDGKWPRPFSDLKSPYHRSAISRAIKQAFVDRRVRVVRTGLGVQPDRIRDLEEKLVQRFGLSAAIVIHPVPVHTHPCDEDEQNDNTHRQLGHAAASFILENGILRGGDRIAISSGRSTYHTVHHLAESLPSRLRDIELISMAGNLRPKHHKVLQNLILDADFNTHELARWFATKVNAKYVGRHAVPRSNFVEIELLRNTTEALSHRTWERPVDVAIFGVGILRPGHRLYTIADEEIKNDNSEYGPLRGPLLKLKRYADHYKDPCPVADIANHLFFIRPLKASGRGSIPTGVQQRIRQQIEEFNSRILTVTDKELSQIRLGILIGGTKQKTVAVLRLLREPYVRYLCTDDEVAESLLKIDT